MFVHIGWQLQILTPPPPVFNASVTVMSKFNFAALFVTETVLLYDEYESDEWWYIEPTVGPTTRVRSRRRVRWSSSACTKTISLRQPVYWLTNVDDQYSTFELAETTLRCYSEFTVTGFMQPTDNSRPTDTQSVELCSICNTQCM